MSNSHLRSPQASDVICPPDSSPCTSTIIPRSGGTLYDTGSARTLHGLDSEAQASEDDRDRFLSDSTGGAGAKHQAGQNSSRPEKLTPDGPDATLSGSPRSSPLASLTDKTRPPIWRRIWSSAYLKPFRSLDPRDDIVERWVTSNLVTPRTLFLVRLVLLAFAIGTTIVLFLYQGYKFFNYLTDWSFIGLTLYLMLSTTASGLYCYFDKAHHHTDPVPNVAALRRLEALIPAPRATRLAYQAIYELFATFHLLVPIVFWTALYSEGFHTDTPFTLYSSMAPHTFDLVVLIIEETLNRQRLHPGHIVFPIIVLGLYWAMSFVMLATQHKYVYPFLDFGEYHGYVVLVLAGCVVGTALIFYTQLALHTRRDRWLAQRWARLSKCGSVGSNLPLEGDAEKPVDVV
ncbi:hypothetical protein IWQ60_004538 [Tieghemiomyces parasiticus]|uniref:Uncharacterized protein n=1 Tax=Tieghemiomyces parasiticus TaxID=78921 RepID=A0A9W8ADG6_9FUNG|nr:hypothetical protein IWQ60_004538 [Tieghemiomyces parasiticus]